MIKSFPKLSYFFWKNTEGTPKTYRSRISQLLNEKTMSFSQRIINTIQKTFGYCFNNDLYNKARRKELSNVLRLKISQDLTFKNISEPEVDIQEKTYIQKQRIKVNQIFSETIRGTPKKNAYQTLYSTFVQNPLLTLTLITLLEKNGLIRCFSIKDLAETLLYSMDWQTGEGPYIKAVQDLKKILESEDLIKQILFNASFESQYQIDLVKEMANPLTPKHSHVISDVSYLSWEFKGFYELGGLAEATFSIAKNFQEQYTNIPINVVLPYFPKLLKDNLKQLEGQPYDPTKIGPSEDFILNNGSILKIRKYKKDKLNIVLIEDKSFEEIEKLYGSKENKGGNVDTMLTFSRLASDYLLTTTKPSSVIHLHDWHVARAATLIKESSIHLATKDKPTIAFTFHNNNVPCQGRFDAQGGGSCYQAAYSEYDVKYGLHLQKQAIACADILSTVSPTYAKECLSSHMGHGLEGLLQEAQKAGRYFGILNGIHTQAWNPYNDPILRNWKSIEKKEPLNLCFEKDKPPYDKKKLALKELNAWIKTYWKTEAKAFNEEKPLFVYTGRYDYDQKGLKHLPALIEEVLKQGGNVLLLGSSADAEAKKMLQELRTKYKGHTQIVVIEDEMKKGKYLYQEQEGDRPGIKELTRMAASAMFMTSNFEPCGLVQLESFKFGSIVIAKKTGGLADTVIPFSSKKGNGYFIDDRSIKEIISETMRNAQDPDVIANIVEQSSTYDWNYQPLGKPSNIQAYKRLYEIGHTHKYCAESQRTKVKMSKAWILHSNAYHEIDPVNTKIHHVLGANTFDTGTKYAVYAPKAKTVILQFFNEHGHIIDSQKMYKSTISGNFIFNTKENKKSYYRFVIDGQIKTDPYAKGFKYLRPEDKIPVCVHYSETDLEFKWTDAAHILNRKLEKTTSDSTSVFEMHLASFAKEHKALNYETMAEKLIEMSQSTGFKKVELMGISEHPYEPSLGYQITGFFAPNHRYGTPQDFKKFVNTLHEAGIEVIVDFVFNHFAQDDWGLKRFDGSNLFEKSNFWDIRQWYGWGRYFNLETPYTQRFIFSSIRNWIETYHIDGFRIDAIKPAHAEFNSFTPRFLQTLNAFIHKHFRGIKTYAEDYRTNSNAIEALNKKGLGFDSKWNLGMIHHCLSYLEDKTHKVSHLIKFVKDSKDNEIFALSHDHVNEKLGFIDTRVKAGTNPLKIHKINHLLLLASLLPGEKLVYHDKAALKALAAIEKIKKNKPTIRDLLTKLPLFEFEITPSINSHLFILKAKNKTDSKGQSYQIIINTSEAQIALPESFKGKKELLTSYELDHDSSEDLPLKEGYLRPLEAHIFET